jgi:PAS domain S-box-containing protein
MLLNPWVGDMVPFAAFYISVTLSALLGGAIPGLLAIVLGALAACYFFIPPIHSLVIAGAAHAVMLAMDVAVALVLVLLATLQRRAAAKADEGRRMLEAVMGHIPEAVAILDAEGRVTMASRHAAELLGREPAPLQPRALGDVVSRLWHPDGKTPARPEELPGSRAIRHGRATEDEEWIVYRTDGTASVVLSRAAPIRDGEGRITGAVVAARDITERKRLEEKLREKAKLESLGVLAGGIAHDFNNLLTSVLGHASMLMSDLPEKSAARQYVREIADAAQHAARLSGQMLAYSGRGRFLVGPLDLSGHVRQLTPEIRFPDSAHVQVKFDLANDLPPIQADASQIRELILNLVCNAVEAIGPKAGQVTIATRLLPVDGLAGRATAADDELPPGTYVALEVADTGPGMDKNTLDRMFEPFFTTKFPGRGLGLAAAMGIVRGHKGAILVDSAPGRGTTVRVLFPTATPSAPGPHAGERPRQARLPTV